MTDLHIVLIQRDKWWVAQCLEHDIGAQAFSIPDAVYELQRSVAGHIAISKEIGKEPFADLPAAPEFYWKKFQGTTLRVESMDLPFRDQLPLMVPKQEVRIAA